MGSTVMRVTTRCSCLEEFVASFAPLVDEESIVIVAAEPRPVGTRQRFEVRLATGEPVLRGDGEVIEAVSGRHLRIRFLALDGSARDVHESMLAFAARQAAAPAITPSGRPALVRVPEATPPHSKPLPEASEWLFMPVPPVPAPLLPTIKMPQFTYGVPPAMPVEVTARNLSTDRFSGLAPPRSHAPRFAIQVNSSLGAPDAIPEPIPTERMIPLLPGARTRPMHFTPPGIPFDVIDAMMRERVTCRLRDVRDVPDRRPLMLAAATGVLVGLAFAIQLLAC